MIHPSLIKKIILPPTDDAVLTKCRQILISNQSSVVWTPLYRGTEAVCNGVFSSSQYGYDGFTEGNGQTTSTQNIYKIVTHTDTDLWKLSPEKINNFSVEFNAECGTDYIVSAHSSVKVPAHGSVDEVPFDFTDGLFLTEVPIQIKYDTVLRYTELGYVAINLNTQEVGFSDSIGTNINIPATCALFYFPAHGFIQCCLDNSVELPAQWTCKFSIN